MNCMFFIILKHVKIYANWMLFAIQSIKLIYMYIILYYKNLKFKYLINDITIDILSP